MASVKPKNLYQATYWTVFVVLLLAMSACFSSGSKQTQRTTQTYPQPPKKIKGKVVTKPYKVNPYKNPRPTTTNPTQPTPAPVDEKVVIQPEAPEEPVVVSPPTPPVEQPVEENPLPPTPPEDPVVVSPPTPPVEQPVEENPLPPTPPEDPVVVSPPTPPVEQPVEENPLPPTPPEDPVVVSPPTPPVEQPVEENPLPPAPEEPIVVSPPTPPVEQPVEENPLPPAPEEPIVVSPPTPPVEQPVEENPLPPAPAEEPVVVSPPTPPVEQPAEEQPTTPEYVEQPAPAPPTEPEVENTAVNRPQEAAVILPPPPNVPQEPFNIAMMLPFNVRNAEFSKKTKLALEFYEGALVALEDLKNQGLNLNVRVYDTESKPEKVQQILNDPILRSSDLIIGPVYNKPLKVVADYARRHQIYQVSPLSPSPKITTQNPFYLIASPPIETHCEAMYNFVMKNFGAKNILALGGSKSKDISLGKMLYELSRQYTQKTEGFPNPNVRQVIYGIDNTSSELEAYLMPDVENVIIATTFDAALINDVMRKLTILSDRYNITVFGMPNWLKMNELDVDYFVNLNFHVTAPYWIDPYDPTHQSFSDVYQYRFQSKPSKNAAAGFDLTSYFGNLYKTHGKNFGYYITNGAQEGIYTNFDFAGGSTEQFSENPYFNVDYLENKHINILHFNRNYMFELMNK